jgi:tetrahydromethanopterin S-methyltransferase subunit B
MNISLKKYTIYSYFPLLLSFFGAIIYKIYALNYLGIIFTLFFSIFSFFIILRLSKKNNQEIHENKNNFTSLDDLIFPSAYILVSLACFCLLFLFRTDIALTSPWEVVPPIFWIFYTLATIILFLCIILNTKKSLILISIHYFLNFSIALIVYKLGYGFDSFVHEATMKLIAETGSVEPKPFYYLGFYAPIIILHKLTFLPIAFLNKIFVPLLASLTLPYFIFKALNKFFANEKGLRLTTLFALILPFNFFILSTPQNLAFLYLLLIILLAIRREKGNEILMSLLALVALVTQPIAGIPACLLVLISITYQIPISLKTKKTILTLAFLAMTFALPTAFYISNQAQSTVEIDSQLTSTSNSIAPYLTWFKPTFPGKENAFLNFIYLFGFNINLIFVALVGLGIYLSRKQKYLILLLLCPALSLVSAYFFTSALSFDYLISYERDAFANRIIITAAFFLFPFALIALREAMMKIFVQNKFIKVAFSIFLLTLLISSLYLSYPRLDNYKNSHGISTNINDIAAVNWIEKNASGEDYIVLANQQVGAAALHEFGFKKYYNDDIFFYPVPTGGPLYQYYLKMVYDKPNQENMLGALDLANVDLGYLVINKYWWAFPKLLEEAKMDATSWEKFADGDVYVFKFIR